MTPFQERRFAEIQALSAGYSCRKKFQNEHPCAYKWLKKYGLIRKAMPNARYGGRWNLEEAKAAASKCVNRTDFYARFSGAAHWARTNNCIDEVLSCTKNQRQKVCADEARAAARLYRTRLEFFKNDQRHYAWCLRQQKLDEYCSHMESVFEKWTVERVAELAMPFSSRKDFERAHVNASRWARFHGVMDDVCSHMEYGKTTSDNDVVYMWQPEGIESVFKVGCTSARIGRGRVEIVASRAGLKPSLVVMKRTGSARAVEKELLELGSPYDFGRVFNGSTEFRMLPPQDVEKAFRILEPFEDLAA